MTKCIASIYNPEKAIVYEEGKEYDVPGSFLNSHRKYFEIKIIRTPENKMVTAAKEETKAPKKRMRKNG